MPCYRAAQPLNSILQPRDLDLFRALARGPLTVHQIQRISTTFSLPYPSVRRLQRRLRILTGDGLLRRHWYATPGPGAVAYYTLSLTAERIVTGDALPRIWRPIGISRQNHVRCLQDFLVHTFSEAFRVGIEVTDFAAEDTLELAVGERKVRPDAAFSLIGVGLPSRRYYIEIDNGTEPVRSDKRRDSFEKKLLTYEALRDSGERFRVLGVVTTSQARTNHLLTLAAAIARDSGRTLFYAIHIADYLAAEDVLRKQVFRDHRGRVVSLMPSLAPR